MTRKDFSIQLKPTSLEKWKAVSWCNTSNLAFTVVNMTEKRLYDITPRETYIDQVESEAALATREGNIWICRDLSVRAVSGRTDVPSVAAGQRADSCPEHILNIHSIVTYLLACPFTQMASAHLRRDYHTVSHYNETHMSKKVERDSYCFTTRQTGGRKCILGKF